VYLIDVTWCIQQINGGNVFETIWLAKSSGLTI